ncbi:F-box protein At4g00755 [Humulus lupulus]|uniref:F-box protein At4g00755 n=1 Tax=Humulus lupulus TaxID=3486 RepID=UPI002B40A246|nr:F-box protein At4g00755 [Humulus lupulus]XP_062090238.1 F-box protein At4g00755 [Humulus lupulus]XP_062090239.1 F-box protein At4g00755 [Humulus lupulus]
MDTRLNPLDCLDSDMIIKIFTFMDDPSDLFSISAVSRSWRHFVVENGFFKLLCLRMFVQLSRVANTMVVKHGETEFGSRSNCMEQESMVRDHRVYAFLIKCCTSFVPGNCLFKAISASSTDNYPPESIDNTLEPREIVSTRMSYWSSTGQSNCEVPETLIYKLASDFCLVSEISIKPFEAFFQEGLPIYSARGMRFRLGHPKSPIDLEMFPVNEPCDDKFIWTYTSEVFQMAQINRLQKFKLPKPVFCIGGYLQIELLGRIQTQEMDGLYYICVSHVKVLGLPLAPALDVEILDQSGNFVLKQYVQADDSPVTLREFKPCSITTFDAGWSDDDASDDDASDDEFI